MRKYILLTLLALTVTACAPYSEAETEGKFVYVQDKSTGLCFAAYHGYSYTHFTNVPCTKEVVAKLEDFKYLKAVMKSPFSQRQ